MRAKYLAVHEHSPSLSFSLSVYVCAWYSFTTNRKLNRQFYQMKQSFHFILYGFNVVGTQNSMVQCSTFECMPASASFYYIANARWALEIHEIIYTTISVFSVFIDTDLVDLSVVFSPKWNREKSGNNLCVHTVCVCAVQKNANDGSPRKSWKDSSTQTTTTAECFH